MDPKKIQAIVDWLILQNVKQVQSYLGFYNFYRRFIEGFAKIAGPLIRLSKKDALFIQDIDYQEVFKILKKRVTTAPVLIYFDPTKKAYIETDLFDYVTIDMLSQIGDDGKLYLVAFYSHKIIPAEYNYKIYDKELLVIIKSFE